MIAPAGPTATSSPESASASAAGSSLFTTPAACWQHPVVQRFSFEESAMSKKPLLVAVAAAAVAGIAYAQYPIMDLIADKVVQKYQSSTCEQLWANKGKHG